MAKFEIKNLDLYYSSFQALMNVSLLIHEMKLLRLSVRPAAESTLLKTLNRMNDLIEGCRIEGGLLDGKDIYGGMDTTLLRKRVGMVFQKPTHFDEHI